jgi:hypothetical protein
MKHKLIEAVESSPWRNVYWFARMLLSGDKYGAVGTKKSQQMLEMACKLEAIIRRSSLSDSEKVIVFQTDIEVDKWFKCKDGWSIGISCKRTLRERWKQVSSADSHALSRYKIKEIWHLITYDSDLSDDKLTMLGQQRQVFYLNQDGERYKSASVHKGMSDYVRPLSRFIADIRREQNG